MGVLDHAGQRESQQRPAALGRQLPFLAKLLDTARELSIQVHPDDDPETGRSGKEEAWVVLDADPGARVLAGICPGVDAATFAAAARRAEVDPGCGNAMIGLLQSIPVQTGTIVLMPAGTIHAVGGGILLAELQQPADCTLRLFDYGSDRTLHLDAALVATRHTAHATIWQPGTGPARLRGKHLALEVLGPGRHERLADIDELLVTFAGQIRVLVCGTARTLPPGALRLAAPGLRYTIEVPDGGGAVSGMIHPTST